ncbi:ABC transporter substrate-binding protein [Catenuloplanes japonicus]|uniref:ABC transporter substrate-binding protein n=1 Tax=Catenuloplanes japonicus TaxID=33876 RepID=UPI00068FBB8C|nr:sugar ABC transporter substrate-binding protein [Catenuloplanes japonicus]
MAAALAGATVITLSACGGGSGGGEGQDLSAQQTITVWTWDQPGKGLEAAVPAFEKQYPNIDVKIENVGNPAIYDKTTTGMAAGGVGLADVINLGIDYMGNYTETFPDGLADLNALGADTIAKDFPPGIWASGSGADGKVYGVPYEVNSAAVYYRKDLFAEVGVDVATLATWDDLLEAGKKLKAKNGTFLFAMDKAASESSSADFFQTLSRLQGTFFFNKDGKITLNDAGSVAALDFLKRANDAGLVADVPGGWDNFMSQIKGQANVAIVPGASWVAGVFAENAPDLAGKWAIRGPLAMKPGGQTAALSGATYLAVAGASEHKKAAFEFVKFALAGTDGAKLVYQGSGLFPGYMPMWETEEFKAPSTYFEGLNVNEFFVGELKKETSPSYYTKDYARALKAYTDAQSQVLLKGADPKTALDEAAKVLAGQTKRDIA